MLRVEVLLSVSRGHISSEWALTDLPYDLRWFCIINGSKILLHCRIVIASLIQKVTISAINGVLLLGVHICLLLHEIYSQDKEVTLVEDLELLLQTLFTIAVELEGMSARYPHNKSLGTIPFHL